jgi:HSP20 family protein
MQMLEGRIAMAFLTLRQSPVDDLFDFRRDFDSIFNRLLTNRSESRETTRTSIPPIQAWIDRENKTYHLRVALPGVNPDEVQITAEGNTLTISGEHQRSEDKDRVAYLIKEFSFERFERTVTLPEGVDAGKINAEYGNGVVEITIPLSETALPRRIEIKNAEKSQAAKA